MLSSPAPAAIVGPTGPGESALAWARRRPGTEIVPVDSTGVYRGMDIGPSKASALEATRRRSPHLARRQWAWFERDPRIVWVDAARDKAELVQAVEAALGESQPCPA